MDEINNEKEKFAKILILGESLVGKTSILRRFTEDVFFDDTLTTLGVDCREKIVSVDDNEIKLKIWDTAGQEKYRSLTKNFYFGSVGVLFVFDVNNRNSIERIGYWIKDLEEYDAVKIIVGNKCDLNQEFSDEYINEILDNNHLKYIKTSAKTGENIENMFNYLARTILKKFNTMKKEEQPIVLKNELNIDEKDKAKKKKNCC